MRKLVKHGENGKATEREQVTRQEREVGKSEKGPGSRARAPELGKGVQKDHHVNPSLPPSKDGSRAQKTRFRFRLKTMGERYRWGRTETVYRTECVQNKG